MSQEQKEKWRKLALETLTEGRDEMNLAEFPLASIGTRAPTGTKTVIFEDTVWDRERREHLPSKLTISGSDRYGLPTATDDDVLLACIQLSYLGEFHQREVHFSRYELLKLLRWSDDTRNYRRVAKSLRCWKGVSIYSDRAFYDNQCKSWVNRDFGVFDNLYIYEREHRDGASAAASSWFVWNEVMYESFQAGYIKKLDWNLYCQLKDPVAKRLYRFLDKRFHWGDELVIDLHELAFNKVRVSRSYDVSQIKRALSKGISELEQRWQLRANRNRFQKVGKGRDARWEVVFERRRPRRKTQPQRAQLQPDSLAGELVKRNIGPAMATELVGKYDTSWIQSVIELHDWSKAKGREFETGLFVYAIRNQSSYSLPSGFQSNAEKMAREAASNSRKRAERESEARREAEESAREHARQKRFRRFWQELSEKEQDEFERTALAKTSRTKIECHARAERERSPVADALLQSILMEHFERLHSEGIRTGCLLPSS